MNAPALRLAEYWMGRNESHADTTVVQDYDDQAPTIATSAPSLGCKAPCSS